MMTNPNARIAELIGKHLKELMSEPECAELNEWLALSDDNRAFLERFNDDQYIYNELEKHYHFDVQAGWEKLIARANIPYRHTKAVFTLFSY